MLQHMDMDMDSGVEFAPHPRTTGASPCALAASSPSQGTHSSPQSSAMTPTPEASPSPRLLDVTKSSPLWSSSPSASSSSSSLTLLNYPQDKDPSVIVDHNSVASSNVAHIDIRGIACDNNTLSSLPSTPPTRQEQDHHPLDQDNVCKEEPGLLLQLVDRQLKDATDSNRPSKPSPSIPSELILHIFKFLTNPHDLRSAILVCKLWCYCGMDLLWSRPALLSLDLVQKMCQTLSMEPSKTTFPYANFIRRLNFSFLAQDISDAELVQFHCCTRLERLLLPACSKTTEEGLMQILQAGHGLYTLDLTEIPTVTDEVIEYVAQQCPKLHTLYLTGCSALTDDSVVKLAASCTSLKRVSHHYYYYYYLYYHSIRRIDACKQ